MSIEAQHAETLVQLVAAFNNIVWRSVGTLHFHGRSCAGDLSITFDVRCMDDKSWEASVARNNSAHRDTTAGSDDGAVDAVRKVLWIRMSHANRRVSECLAAMGPDNR